MTEISHTDCLVDSFSMLPMNPLYSDVTFLVDLERIPAHRMILATRSEYFRAMLKGDFSESQIREINLPVPLHPFKLILNYIYTGRMSLTAELIGDVFDLANLFGLVQLEQSVITYLQDTLSVESALCTQRLAAIYGANELLTLSESFINANAEQILQQKTDFNKLSQDFVLKLIQSDSFYAKEENIFFAVKEWCAHNPDADVQTLMSDVRFCLMDRCVLDNTITPSGLVDREILSNCIENEDHKNNPPRRYVMPCQPVYTVIDCVYDLKFQQLINFITFKLTYFKK